MNPEESTLAARPGPLGVGIWSTKLFTSSDAATALARLCPLLLEAGRGWIGPRPDEPQKLTPTLAAVLFTASTFSIADSRRPEAMRVLDPQYE